jgi:hypothetical protein
MIVLLGISGLALDSGRGYLRQLHLARAVDAAALTAARNLRSGQAVAEQQGRTAAEANGLVDGQAGASLNISFASNEFGERTVSVSTRQPLPTVLMRILGHDEMDVAAAAVAAVPPVDLVLVLDQSRSLYIAGAWDDLQDAAKSFIDYFDDDMDQLGLVSFHTIAADRHYIDHGFTGSIRSSINAMDSRGYTNTGEGLHKALEQITGPAVRERSVKVVVFFTDGRPTGFRTVTGIDRIETIRQTDPINRFNGFFNGPESLDIDVLDHNTTPDGCSGVLTCDGVDALTAYEFGRTRGLEVANEIREEDVFLYTIGLGNPFGDPAFLPDQDYLRQLANEDGISDPSQPSGRMYFAPSAAELEEVFRRVAQDILVRLAQ